MIQIDALGLHLDNPLKVYHASLNATAIIRNREFDSTDTREDTKALVSFTGDTRVAEALCVALGTVIRLQFGDLKFDELLDEYKLACPKSYKAFTSRYRRDIQHPLNPDNAALLYQYMLFNAAAEHEAFDPDFFRKDSSVYSHEDLTQLKDIGYVSVNIKPDVVIYPYDSRDFDDLLKKDRVFEFAKTSFGLSTQVVRPISKQQITDRYKPLLSEKSFEISKDYQVKDRRSVANDLEFAEYSKALNQYRVTQDALDLGSLFYQKSLLDIYLDDLPRLWSFERKSSEIKSFYPYFNCKTIGLNLSLDADAFPKNTYNAIEFMSHET